MFTVDTPSGERKVWTISMARQEEQKINRTHRLVKAKRLIGVTAPARVETEVRVTYRNDQGKIIRIDKAWGNDPTLQRFTRIGCEPVGARYKTTLRERLPQAIDRLKNYTPAEVATMLNVSYDTAIRRMEKMKGCVDLGTKEKRYKRGKRMLRISGAKLLDYLRSKQK